MATATPGYSSHVNSYGRVTRVGAFVKDPVDGALTLNDPIGKTRGVLQPAGVAKQPGAVSARLKLSQVERVGGCVSVQRHEVPQRIDHIPPAVPSQMIFRRAGTVARGNGRSGESGWWGCLI